MIFTAFGSVRYSIIEYGEIRDRDKEFILQKSIEKYGKPVSVELGPGRIDKPRDHVTIGLNESADYYCDIYMNLEYGLPFPDESVHSLFSAQLLEHISRERTIFFFNEMHRVLVPGGKMHHVVPHYLSPWAVADPTHKNLYSQHSFRYYCLDADGKPFVDSFSDYGITARFIMEKMEVVDRLEIRVWMRKA